MNVGKPRELFDRDSEWADLVRFAGGEDSRLGVVWGPRRVGKSFILSALCERVGGLYIQAVRQDRDLSLAAIGRLLADRLGTSAPLRLDDWSTAIKSVFDLPDTPLVVLDEFPYLVEGAPELPTVVQAIVDDRARRGSGARLILCGSAVAQMTSLLGTDGPLFRRAGLSLAVRPFDLRAGATYWGLDGRPVDALTQRTIVGGTPGYRDVFGAVDGDLDEWVAERVLDPTRTTFHEDELTFATDPSLPDANVYRSIIVAITSGERTPTGVARTTGRKVTSIGRPLDRLVDAGIVTRTTDPLRAKRSLLDVGDPFLRFHYAVIRPNRAALARRRGHEVWEMAAETFRSQVLGPQFEVICRDAVLDHGLGGPGVADVGATVLRNEAANRSFEVDVVGTDTSGRVTLIGEVKASDAPRGVEDLARLDRLRELVPGSRRAAQIHLALFAMNGADAHLSEQAHRRDDVSVIDGAALLGT